MGCGTSKVADDENNISAKNKHKESSDGVTSATYLANGSQSSVQNNREKIQIEANLPGHILDKSPLPPIASNNEDNLRPMTALAPKTQLPRIDHPKPPLPLETIPASSSPIHQEKVLNLDESSASTLLGMEEADLTDNAKKYLTTNNDDDDAENAVSQNEENHSRMADSFIEPEKEAQTDGEGLKPEASQTDLEVVEGANEASQTVEVEVEVENLDVEVDDDNDVVSPAISRGASAKSQRSTVANLGVEDDDEEEDSDEKTLVEEEPEKISQDELDSEEKEVILEIEENAKEMDDEDMKIEPETVESKNANIENQIDEEPIEQSNSIEPVEPNESSETDQESSEEPSKPTEPEEPPKSAEPEEPSKAAEPEESVEEITGESTTENVETVTEAAVEPVEDEESEEDQPDIITAEVESEPTDQLTEKQTKTEDNEEIAKPPKPVEPIAQSSTPVEETDSSDTDQNEAAKPEELIEEADESSELIEPSENGLKVEDDKEVSMTNGKDSDDEHLSFKANSSRMNSSSSRGGDVEDQDTDSTDNSRPVSGKKSVRIVEGHETMMINGHSQDDEEEQEEPIKRNIKSPFEDPEGDSNLEEDEEVDVPITNLNPNRSTSAISVG